MAIKAILTDETGKEIVDELKKINSGAIAPEKLAENMEGDDFIVVDLNSTNDKVRVSLDTDYQPHIVELSGISGTLTDTQYNMLCGNTSSYTAQILINGEFYLIATEKTTEDKYCYHESDDNGITLKTVTINKSTKAWTLSVAYSNAVETMHSDNYNSSTLVGGEPLELAYLNESDGHFHMGSTIKCDASIEVEDNLKVSGCENLIGSDGKPMFAHFSSQSEFETAWSSGTIGANTISIVDDVVTLISFKIDGTSYRAEDGMTWAEWCDSDYNTGGYYVEQTYNRVRNVFGDIVSYDELNCVHSSDTIDNNYNYLFMGIIP